MGKDSGTGIAQERQTKCLDIITTENFGIILDSNFKDESSPVPIYHLTTTVESSNDPRTLLYYSGRIDLIRCTRGLVCRTWFGFTADDLDMARGEAKKTHKFYAEKLEKLYRSSQQIGEDFFTANSQHF